MKKVIVYGMGGFYSKVKEQINNEVEIIAYAIDEKITVDEALKQEIANTLGITTEVDLTEGTEYKVEDLLVLLTSAVHARYEAKEEMIGSEELREIERVIVLKIVDQQWMEHIDNMDELKNGIGLRAYGQKDPVVQLCDVEFVK